jgi:2-oxoglutarate dehydrogenase E2 component (dihydrolipoamide succinyltransferase)
VEVNTIVARIAAAGAAAPSGETKPAPAAETPSAETKPGPPPDTSKPEPAKPSVPSPTAPKPPPTPAPKSPPPPAPTPPSPSAPTPGVRASQTAAAREPVEARGTGVATLEERVRTKSSPLVRKMAAEHDADITQIQGTGIHGRVTKQDFERHLESVEAAVSAPPAPAEQPAAPAAQPARPAPARPAPAAPAPAAARTFAAAAGPGDRVEPMSVMRLKIAEHMIESRRTSAHVQTFWEIDFSHLDRLRREHGEQFLQRNGVKLTYTAFIAKATCDALKAVPIVNSSVSGTEIVYHGAINLGIAVALDWGLIVPVVKNAGDMNTSGLARAITDLAGRARSKRLSPDEVTGGTFTITNPGVYGGLFGCPIINQPQVAILGVGAVEKRPVVIEDAIAIHPMCYLSLSFDHRVIDGSVAEMFMGELKKSLLALNESAL